MAIPTTASHVGDGEHPAAGGLIAERAYDELRHRIVTLRLAPGTALREDDLMAELGIGRTPLREAVKRLALESLVAVQPRRGTYVTEVNAADIVQITELRAELEGFAAWLAAQRLDAADRRAAGALLDEVRALAGDEPLDDMMALDQRVHRFAWRAARNDYLVDTLERAFTLSERIWYLVLERVPGLGAAVHEQEELLHALLAGDADGARNILRDHVLAFQHQVVAAF